MDLSKVLDCISHDLLVPKLHVYVISLNAATLYIHTLNAESKIQKFMMFLCF